MQSRRGTIIAVVVIGIIAGLTAVAATQSGRALLWSAFTRLRGRATVESRLAELNEATRRMHERCVAAELPFPPSELTIVALKDTRVVRVLARSGSKWRRIVEFPVLAASGVPGPKLAAGDRQVPEGIYPVESLNPNSMFHLALRVGYPNAFERDQAARDGRTDLGGDIMIHGGNASIGCLAIGDPAIEELFVLVASVGVDRTRIIIAPTESVTPDAVPPNAPAWVPDLYQSLQTELAKLSSAG
jgi:hypothetical protein